MQLFLLGILGCNEKVIKGGAWGNGSKTRTLKEPRRINHTKRLQKKQ